MQMTEKFHVEMDGRRSEWKEQKTGIRQGCPLSPYLFIIFMTVLFHDIHENDELKTARQRIKGTDVDQVLYADDTICIAQNERAMNRILKAIEEEGEKYGVRLNKDKCEYLGFGGAKAVKFKNGQKVPKKEEVKYLGSILNTKGDLANEIQSRIGTCTGTIQKLHFFFRESHKAFVYGIPRCTRYKGVVDTSGCIQRCG